MHYDRIRKLELAAKKDEIDRAMERYEIFIAGPYIDVKKDKGHPDNSSSAGKAVRFGVYEYYSSLKHNIYLGEDVELRTIGEKHYGSSSNAAFFERHYIVNNIDALLVFPDGPGVFCELGDWATTKSTCEKMLILIDKQYEGKTSYINDGTVKAARHFGAQVAYVDYGDIGAIQAECDKFLDVVAVSARVEKLFER